jgi:hypothetical protein
VCVLPPVVGRSRMNVKAGRARPTRTVHEIAGGFSRFYLSRRVSFRAETSGATARGFGLFARLRVAPVAFVVAVCSHINIPDAGKARRSLTKPSSLRHQVTQRMTHGIEANSARERMIGMRPPQPALKSAGRGHSTMKSLSRIREFEIWREV